MNLDSLSFALSQISYSVANLTKKNYKANVTEISTVSLFFNIIALSFNVIIFLQHYAGMKDGGSGVEVHIHRFIK